MPLPFLAPLIGTGISALAGLFGGRRQQPSQTQNFSSQSSGGQSGSFYTDPRFNRNATDLMNTFTKAYLDKFYSGPENLRGYEESGIRQINDNAGIQRDIISNLLAQRGLSFSPAASVAEIGNEQNRINQITGFRNQIPLLQRQLEQENMANLVNAFRSIPFGQEGQSSNTFQNIQSGTQQGSQIIPGNMLGGLMAGAGSMLPFLMSSFRGRSNPFNYNWMQVR